MTASVILLIPALALLCAPAIWLVLGRPRFLPMSGKAGKGTAISIIIPARDEEDNIERLLESLNHQSLPPLEIIVVNDGSTDRTAEVAQHLGARVIDAAPLPAGWNGKPWACQQGADSAAGQWLLFLDADLVLEPQAINSLTRLCQSPDQVYSVCPHHVIRKSYEELSAFFNVLMLAGVNAFGPEKHAVDDSALFGQCLLISRDHYQTVGGHAEVKGEVLENFRLATRLKARGIRRACYLGKGLMTMRMFPHGIAELRASWKKGFVSGAANTPPRALVSASVWISGLMLTIVSVGLALTPYRTGPLLLLTTIAYLIHAGQCLYVFRLAGTFSVWNALFFPVSLLFYQGLFFSSLIAKNRGSAILWKGRAIR